jgi:lysophospholipase L1-like esterase
VATYLYGRSPNDYVEVPDSANPGQVRRPVAADAVVVAVRNHETLAALPSLTPGAYGYLSFTADAPAVEVSTDGFETVKVLRGEEALDAAVEAALAATTDLSGLREDIADKAPLDSPNFTGTVSVNGNALPALMVEANVANARLIFPPAADPDADGAYEITVIPGEQALKLPTARPATEQVVTVKPDGTQSLVSLAGLGGGGTTPGSGGANSVAATARRILAAAAGQERINALAAHPNPPTVTVAAGSATTITGGIRIGLKRANATTIDTVGDPHFDYPGARPGKITVFSTDKAYASYLTGGTSQNRRDYWRCRTTYSGAGVMQWIVQARTTTLSYRVWVDGMPLTVDQQKFTTTAGSNYLMTVDFGTTQLGPRTVELEVNDPTFGGCYVGPTDSLSRYRSPRAVMCGFGDSHTAGANGVGVGDTWLTWAARLLGLDAANMAIGGSGFFASATNGADFRQRVIPDVVPMNPDIVVFPGGYNDVAATTTPSTAALGTEADYVYGLLRQNLPNAVIIPAGPFWQTQVVGASAKGQDDAQRAAAIVHDLPFISFIDPAGLMAAGAMPPPAWAASTAYGVGDVVTSSNNAWKAVSAHTSGTTFDTTRWRALSFVTGTGKSTALAGNGNADVIVSSDGIHMTAQGHKIAGYFMATEITRCLRDLAA